MPPSVTLIDTRPNAHPAEACLYGDDMLLIEETLPCAGRWLTLTGPDGEISLPAPHWRRIAQVMGII